MEKRVENNLSIFIEWIKVKIVAKEVDYEIIHKLNSEIELKEGWSVTNTEIINDRYFPFSKSLGYIIIPTEFEESICSNLEITIIDSIENGNYTSQGLCNVLILIDRIGSINNGNKYEIIKRICSKINAADFLSVIKNMIDALNTYYKSPQSLENNNLSFHDWEQLIFRRQYHNRFDDPIGLLRILIQFKISELPILDLIHRMLPDVRSGLFEFGIPLNHLTKDDILQFVKTNQTESSFIALLVTDSFKNKSSLISSELILLFINENWNTVGKYLFSKAFNKTNRKPNEDIINILQQTFHSFLIKEFSSDKNSTGTIISKFEWPSDYFSFGGWLEFQELKSETDILFNNQFINDLASSFSKELFKIKQSIPDLILNSQKVYNIWFSDIFDSNAQNATTYITFSIMHCDSSVWEITLSNFTALCNSIKELYYGAYQANHLAQKLSNYLLILILTCPKYKDDTVPDLKRLNILMKTFIDSIGHQWVYYIERNKIIWNHENYTPSFMDTEIVFILKMLENIPKPYFSLYNILIQFAFSNASAQWPLYRIKDEDINPQSLN